MLQNMAGKLKTIEENVLNNTKQFTVFCIINIVAILVYYSFTKDELLPVFYLSMLWFVFWKNSTTTEEKTMLVGASLIGIFHEILGANLGWFTYTTGMAFGAPTWIMPGYGVIFWASYNLWTHFEEHHHLKEKLFSKTFIIGTAVLITFDLFVLNLLNSPSIFIAIPSYLAAFSLFQRGKERHLAVATGAMTLFDELAGEMIGAWSHPIFFSTSLMAAYLFALWIFLTAAKIIKKEKTWRTKELAAATFLTVLFVGKIVFGNM
ncbi:MAG: hypothetical protein J7K00_04210 [Candidatus Diapherotrites archaeon]|nr:hypothetical protein [Candidatus Diapherotrites archaeon]